MQYAGCSINVIVKIYSHLNSNKHTTASPKIIVFIIFNIRTTKFCKKCIYFTADEKFQIIISRILDLLGQSLNASKRVQFG